MNGRGGTARCSALSPTPFKLKGQSLPRCLFGLILWLRARIMQRQGRKIDRQHISVVAAKPCCQIIAGRGRILPLICAGEIVVASCHVMETARVSTRLSGNLVEQRSHKAESRPPLPLRQLAAEGCERCPQWGGSRGATNNLTGLTAGTTRLHRRAVYKIASVGIGIQGYVGRFTANRTRRCMAWYSRTVGILDSRRILPGSCGPVATDAAGGGAASARRRILRRIPDAFAAI